MQELVQQQQQHLEWGWLLGEIEIHLDQMMEPLLGVAEELKGYPCRGHLQLLHACKYHPHQQRAPLVQVQPRAPPEQM